MRTPAPGSCFETQATHMHGTSAAQEAADLLDHQTPLPHPCCSKSAVSSAAEGCTLTAYAMSERRKSALTKITRGMHSLIMM